MTEPFVDAQTVAGFLGFEEDWVYDRAAPMANDPMPSYQFGYRLRFRLSEIESWVARYRRRCESGSVVPLRRSN